jgi:hypothetical protein
MNIITKETLFSTLTSSVPIYNVASANELKTYITEVISDTVNVETIADSFIPPSNSYEVKDI